MTSLSLRGALCLAAAAAAAAAPNVRVALYEESKCPYCCEFMSNAWSATYNESCTASMVSSWVAVPYGNAKTDANNVTTCQHGPDECKGNKLQACAKRHYPAEAAWVSLFRCMGAAYPDPVGSAQACGEAAGMDWSVVETCYSNGEGDALIYANAQVTNALNPKKQGVPWVVVNDVPVDDRDHLLAAICDAFVGTKPDCCAAAARRRTRRADPLTRGA